jgi:asparagine synthase (glutamine-hydrolysing)
MVAPAGYDVRSAASRSLAVVAARSTVRFAMCGICGVISLTGVGVERSVLEAMNQALVHRGPDSEGSLVEGPVALGARRLAIIDLAGGNQPIWNEDGTIAVVQNGEIYNYRSLRDDLERRGHRFSTHSDTEVLVHLYEEHDLRFVDHLRGMFAIAIWDGRRRRLVLARDRFGIKPLYYHVNGDVLAFASELKSLIRHPGFSREIDADALEAYLAFSFVPAPLTIFSAARKLEAGCVLTWEEGSSDIRIESYADVRCSREVRRDGEEALAQELLARLRDSVRAHLVADVPVGVLLSGGLDSSTLAALAAEESTDRVSTFTIGFEERGFDEREPARLVAQRYGTDHHELVLTPDAAELLPELAAVFDEPFADSSAIPTYLVSRLARQKVKVALSGEGGDELFGGYNYYVGHLLAPRLKRLARLARPVVDRVPTSSRAASTLDWQAKRFVRGAHLPPLERHYAWKSVFSPAERRSVLRRECRGSLDPLALLQRRDAHEKHVDGLTRVVDLDLGIFLVDDMLVKTDRASMAHSLETRVPILDTVVAELGLALPHHLKVRGLAKKRLLRRAVAPLLPEPILHGKKRGFSIPLAAWLQGELQPFVRDVLSPENVRRQGFFEADGVRSLVDDHVAGRADQSRKIWALLAFSLWFDRYVSPSAP